MTTSTPIPTATDIHRLALEAIPGWASDTDRAARLDQFSTTADTSRVLNERLVQAQANLRQAVLDVADGREGDPRAAAREIQELNDALTIERVVAAAAVTLRGQMQQSTRDLDTTQKDAGLAYLSRVLDALMEEVRELDPTLGAIGSASAAFRGTPAQLSAWQRLDTLVDVYDALREAQRHILTQGNGGPVTLGRFYRVGLLADQLDRDRYWITRRLDLARVNYQAPADHAAFLAWLSPWRSPDEVNAQAPLGSLEGTVWPDSDRHSYLRWVATTATAWVPSIGQMEAADTAALAALQINGLNAAHEYYRITKATPLRPLPALASKRDDDRPVTWDRLTRSDRVPERTFA